MARAPQQRPRIVQPRRIVQAVVAALILVIVFTVFRSVFAIQRIDVQGNQYVTRDEVVLASGLTIGQSVLTVSTDKVREGINRNRYLEFVGIWRNLIPPYVVLTVSEHTPRAKLMWMGMLLILGDDGVVLERTSQIDMPLYVPEVIGMTVENVAVGHPVEYALVGQEEAINGVLDALQMQGVTSDIIEINISSPDNLTLMTEGGLQIILGDGERLDEKIALMRDMVPRIDELNLGSGGILNVSSAESADYRPPPR